MNIWIKALIAAFAITLSVAAHAQSSRQVRFIVPFPAGGGADLLIRVLAEQIGKMQGIATVVENRPGAASMIGTEAASRAAPDGNTLLIVANSFIIHPNFKKLNYDPLTSFEPVCLLANSPQVIVVNSTSPYRTLADLVNAARAKPGELSHASVGPASTQQIAFEQFKLAAKINMTYRAVQRQRAGAQRAARRSRFGGDGELRRSSRACERWKAARARQRRPDPTGGLAQRSDRRRARLSGLRSRRSGMGWSRRPRRRKNRCTNCRNGVRRRCWRPISSRDGRDRG